MTYSRLYPNLITSIRTTSSHDTHSWTTTQRLAFLNISVRFCRWRSRSAREGYFTCRSLVWTEHRSTFYTLPVSGESPNEAGAWRSELRVFNPRPSVLVSQSGLCYLIQSGSSWRNGASWQTLVFSPHPGSRWTNWRRTNSSERENTWWWTKDN